MLTMTADILSDWKIDWVPHAPYDENDRLWIISVIIIVYDDFHPITMTHGVQFS